MQADFFFNIDTTGRGIERELAPGITTTIYNGDHAMISVVRFAAKAKGELHHHPEEQWGFCQSGSGVRFQGEETIPVGPGDFWRTPGGVPHTMEASDDGLVVIDVFAPPRKAYTAPGSGFAMDDEAGDDET